MKKYIRSSYTFDPWKNADLSKWSDEEIEIYNNTDWQARNYESLYVYEDSFEGNLYIYGLPGGQIVERVTFVKEIYPNTIYSPKYVVPDWYQSPIYKKYKNKGYAILSPSVESTRHQKDGILYKVADRSETQELYDMLSR